MIPGSGDSLFVQVLKKSLIADPRAEKRQDGEIGRLDDDGGPEDHLAQVGQ